jgi:hypothetical protein
VPALVDSDVILDVTTDNADWRDWSAAMLTQAAHEGRLVINPLIYAEVGQQGLFSLSPAPAGAPHPCRISTSARMLRSPATHC